MLTSYTMESSGMDTACLAGLQACRPTLGAWPSPPAAHSNSILGNNISSSNSNIHSINSSNFGINSSTSNSSVSASQISMSIGGIPGGLGLGHHPASVAAAAAAAAAVAGSTTPGAVSFPGLMTPCSDNDNNSNMSSDCGSTNNMNGGGGGQSSFSGVANMDGGDGAGSENVGNGKSSRQNQVGSIHLHGENIVSLIIDNKERLCLAQISNTLLKEYSYNEIHNRRVALGITCVQCTPVQLEILRRAGAMPVSSRRCGMITKREAERLVRSFLEENTPPKLPDDFAFDVHHECGWGCRGFFEPSRYNSSRAKCIKCFYCNVYFSPNKFIFHFHRTSESKYSHPDAANFNSWRRHLKLYSGNENEEITYKWEDVKAMFNGGTRKRPFPTSSSSSSSLKSSHSTSSASLSSPGSHHRHHSHHGSHSHSHLSPPSSLNTSGRGASLSSSEISGAAQSLAGMYGGRSSHLHFDGSGGGGASSAKKSKQAANVPSLDSNPYMQKHPGAPFVNPFSPYWLAATSTGASKAPYPFMAMNASQSMCFGFPPAPHPGPTQHPNSKDIMSDRAKTAHLSPASWISRASAAAAAAAGGAPPFPMPSMDFFWDKAFAFPQAAGLSFRPGTYPSALMPSAVSNSSGGGGPGSVNIGALNSIGGPGASLMELPEHFNPDGQMNHSPPERGGSYSRVPHHHREIERGEKVKDHMSAFKRVRPSSSSPSSSGSPPPPHATFDDHDDIDRDCPDDANTQADRYNDNNNNYSSSGNNNNGNHSPPQNSDDKVVDGHAGGDDRDEDGVGSVCAEDLSTQRELEESEDIDVEEEGISAEIAAAQRADSEGEEEEEEKNCNLSWGQERSKADGRRTEAECAEERESNQRLKTQELVKGDDQSPEPSSQPTSPLRPGSSQSITDGRGASGVIAVAKGQDSGLSDESDTEAENRKQLVEMSPDELRNSLMNEVESRRKREKEVDVLKETFRQEVSREKSFREHMAQQLEMLRETLTTELEQERKMRFSLQQKLKEAHDALQNFSCGMLTGRKDVFPLKDSDALPR